MGYSPVEIEDILIWILHFSDLTYIKRAYLTKKPNSVNTWNFTFKNIIGQESIFQSVDPE